MNARNTKPLYKLSAAFCDKVTQPGRYGDGGNLALFVQFNAQTGTTRKSWVFRFRDKVTGQRHDMGLGNFGRTEREGVTLAQARDLAGDYRALLRQNLNPLRQRKEELEQARRAAAKDLTFGQCATQYIALNRHEWRNPKHAAQWESTLETYGKPIWSRPVSDIDTDDVLRCLEPHWTDRTETMTRVRQRIEAVLAWATVKRLRHGDNPARWKNHLDKILPKPTKLKRIEHRAALEYRRIGGFMAQLRGKGGTAAKALEFLILTATRPNEAFGAQWSEIDLEAALWHIPAARMKADKDHEVPLSAQAVTLLKSLPRRKGSDCVFFGLKGAKPLTTAAGMKVLKSIEEGLSQHGFRSTFREWAAEQTHFPREVIEHALSHQLRDKAEAAYHRKTMLPKRVKLMQAWASYCDVIQTEQADNVVSIGKPV